MFGRVRASSTSPDELEIEVERDRHNSASSSSKLLKQDSLSIYESTLLKLKRGSLNAIADEEMQIDDGNGSHSMPDPVVVVVAAPASSSPDSITVSPGPSPDGNSSRAMSIQQMFSRYKVSKAASSSSQSHAGRHQMMTAEITLLATPGNVFVSQ